MKYRYGEYRFTEETVSVGGSAIGWGSSNHVEGDGQSLDQGSASYSGPNLLILLTNESFNRHGKVRVFVVPKSQSSKYLYALNMERQLGIDYNSLFAHH